MNLAILVNKPVGFTSRDVVNKLNKILNTKAIGHTGTLDPLASGVLICLVGKYTKLVNIITNEEKEYIATIKLGMSSDTLDITGNIIKEEEIPNLKIEDIDKVLKSFIGTYEEVVPLYSAVHVNGKRLYEYAREKKEVELPKRIVEIKEIELLQFKKDIIKFRVLVSKGTYIRSLIQSICEKLNTIGVMESLVRTKQGKFSVSDSYNLEDIEKGNYNILKIDDLIYLEREEIPENLEKKIINGNEIEMDKNGYILFTKNNQEKCLYYFENGIGKLKILL